MLEIKELKRADSEWDKRVLESDGSFYQTISYSKYLEKALGMELIYLVVKNKEEIVGQMVFHFGPRFAKYLKNRNRITFKIVSRFLKTGYSIRGPTIINNNYKKEIYSMIIEYLDEKFKKSGFMIQDWSLPINEEEWAHQLFYDKGFYSDSWGTIVVNTTKAEEELWKNLKKSRRNIVRRGINLGLKVKEARTKKDYDMVISIIKETSKRNNIFFHPQRYYRTLFDILSKKEMSKTFFIEEKGKGVATITMYLFGRRAIQTMVAHSDYSLQNQIPGTDFLEWHNIKWCHDNGYLTYDLAGIRPDSSDKKDISLKEYKQRWGGDIIRYPYFSKEYSKSKKGFVNKLMKVKRFLVKLSSG